MARSPYAAAEADAEAGEEDPACTKEKGKCCADTGGWLLGEGSLPGGARQRVGVIGTSPVRWLAMWLAEPEAVCVGGHVTSYFIPTACPLTAAWDRRRGAGDRRFAGETEPEGIDPFNRLTPLVGQTVEAVRLDSKTDDTSSSPESLNHSFGPGSGCREYGTAHAEAPRFSDL